MRSHKIYLVDVSAWPLVLSCWLIFLVVSFVEMFRTGLFFPTLPILLVAYYWGRDIVREGAYIGAHLSTITNAILIAMKLFIFSEVIFFSGFFASLFYTMYAGEVCCGMTFPAAYVVSLDPYGIPLLNTALLLSSGVTVTWGHSGLSGSSADTLCNGLLLSAILGVVFLSCQFIEYNNCDFTISSGIYGSNFFALTGFHSFHVCVSIISLLVCWSRSWFGNNYFGNGASCDCFIWYWHFVDVVWLFLFLVVYILISEL